MFVDSHCHLDHLQKDNSLKDIVDRASRNEVKTLLTISTRLDETIMIQAIASQYDNVFCSIGVHPSESEEVKDFSAEDLAQSLIKKIDAKTIALGETGLDYYYDSCDREVQKKSFLAHIQASQTTGLPLIIHTRDAEEDTVKFIKDANTKGVIHCFTGSQDLAKACLDLGYYISISGIVTFKKAENLQEIVKWLPLDRILIETDSPWLAPIPYRGKPNEPAYVVHVAEKIAELKGISVKRVGEVTTENFFNLFQKVKQL